MADYIAFIHKDRKSGYGVSFPDLPGVVTVADTLEGVRKEAEEALALHIEGMVEDGEDVPAPSTLDFLAGDEVFKDAVAVVVIHVADIATPTVRVNITLPEAMLRRIDEHAAVHGFTRSGFLVQAAKKALAARRQPQVGQHRSRRSRNPRRGTARKGFRGSSPRMTKERNCYGRGPDRGRVKKNRLGRAPDPAILFSRDTGALHYQLFTHRRRGL